MLIHIAAINICKTMNKITKPYVLRALRCALSVRKLSEGGPGGGCVGKLYAAGSLLQATIGNLLAMSPLVNAWSLWAVISIPKSKMRYKSVLPVSQSPCATGPLTFSKYPSSPSGCPVMLTLLKNGQAFGEPA